MVRELHLELERQRAEYACGIAQEQGTVPVTVTRKKLRRRGQEEAVSRLRLMHNLRFCSPQHLWLGDGMEGACL